MTCGIITEAVLDGDITQHVQECAICGRKTLHETICNGGTKVITYGTDGVDVNSYIHTAQVKAGVPRREDVGTERESVNADPIRDKAGKVIHERATFINDGLKAKREKRDWKRKRLRYGHKVQVG